MSVLFFTNKYEITLSERNILGTNNKRLDAKIDALHNSIDVLESKQRMTHNSLHPWSKALGIRIEFLKPIACPLKELQNLTFMGDILNHTYSDTPVTTLSSLHDTSEK
mgnify:CR=1 FL=1